MLLVMIMIVLKSLSFGFIIVLANKGEKNWLRRQKEGKDGIWPKAESWFEIYRNLMNLHNNEAGRRVSLIIVSQLSPFLGHIYKNHHETVGIVRMPTSSYGQCYCSKANLSSNQRWHFDNWVEVFLLLLHSPSHCPYPSIVPIHVFQVCTYAPKIPQRCKIPLFSSRERRTVQIIIVIYGTAKEFGASRS